MESECDKLLDRFSEADFIGELAALIGDAYAFAAAIAPYVGVATAICVDLPKLIAVLQGRTPESIEKRAFKLLSTLSAELRQALAEQECRQLAARLAAAKDHLEAFAIANRDTPRELAFANPSAVASLDRLGFAADTLLYVTNRLMDDEFLTSGSPLFATAACLHGAVLRQRGRVWPGELQIITESIARWHSHVDRMEAAWYSKCDSLVFGLGPNPFRVVVQPGSRGTAEVVRTGFRYGFGVTGREYYTLRGRFGDQSVRFPEQPYGFSPTRPDPYYSPPPFDYVERDSHEQALTDGLHQERGYVACLFDALVLPHVIHPVRAIIDRMGSDR